MKQPRFWKITILLQDVPEEDEEYLSHDEIELAVKRDLQAGLAFDSTAVEHVVVSEVKDHGQLGG